MAAASYHGFSAVDEGISPQFNRNAAGRAWFPRTCLLSLGVLAAMSLDVVDLRNFYAQPLGTVARRFVSRGIRMRWADTRGHVSPKSLRTPYLGFSARRERCLAFIAGAHGW